MVKTVLSLSFCLISSGFFSQLVDGCDGERYRYRIFDDFTVENNVQYGNNIDVAGNEINLFMDIYRPLGDVDTSRAVVVAAHGGFFLTGSKDGLDIVPICEDLARMGFVVASISYRLGIENIFSPAVSLQEATVRAVHDAKAAIRYFRRTHEQDGNPWGIDPDRIVLGGSSAGGFIALHTAYVDDVSEIPTEVDLEGAYGLEGGLEGISGSPGYPSNILSVFSFSGAIGEVSWIEPGDAPVVSTHGTSDNTVPFGEDFVQLFGVNVIEVDGSETVHNMANSLDIDNCFYIFNGANHTPHTLSAAYYDTTRAVMAGFTSRQVCPIYPPICGYYDVDSPPEVGSTCPEDLVEDGLITVADVLEVLAEYGCMQNCNSDVNADGYVTVSDVLAVIAVFGNTCPT